VNIVGLACFTSLGRYKVGVGVGVGIAALPARPLCPRRYVEVLRERAAWALYLRRRMVVLVDGVMVVLVDGVVVLVDGIVVLLADSAVMTPFSPVAELIVSGVDAVGAGVVAVCHTKGEDQEPVSPRLSSSFASDTNRLFTVYVLVPLSLCRCLGP